MSLATCRGCRRTNIRSREAIQAEVREVPARALAFAEAQPARIVPTIEDQLCNELGYLNSAYRRLIDELMGFCSACSCKAWLAGTDPQPALPPAPPRPRAELVYVREDSTPYSEVA
jgi:hypothetical protein